MPRALSTSTRPGPPPWATRPRTLFRPGSCPAWLQPDGSTPGQQGALGRQAFRGSRAARTWKAAATGLADNLPSGPLALTSTKGRFGAAFERLPTHRLATAEARPLHAGARALPSRRNGYPSRCSVAATLRGALGEKETHSTCEHARRSAQQHGLLDFWASEGQQPAVAVVSQLPGRVIGMSLTKIEDSQHHQRVRMASFRDHYSNAQILAPPR